jgi:hypothetical protein
MSGTLIAQHERFAIKKAVTLSAAGQTDAALQANLSTATTIVRTGAQHLDTIAIRRRALSVAEHIRSLQYDIPDAPPVREPQFPAGPIVFGASGPWGLSASIGVRFCIPT